MINQAALNLIREFEGLRLTAYQDGGGVWTIGHGTTAAAGVGCIPRAGMTCTEAQADAWFHAAVTAFAKRIGAMMTRDASDNQFGAMVSLAYNIGPGAFAKSSVLRKFNAGDMAGAAGSFRLWSKDNGKVVAGLTRRRAAEAKLFSTH